jgi:hypothetical protein
MDFQWERARAKWPDEETLSVREVDKTDFVIQLSMRTRLECKNCFVSIERYFVPCHC